MLLILLKEMLHEGEILPSEYYEAQKINCEFSLTYNKIDVFRNDCMLY